MEDTEILEEALTNIQAMDDFYNEVHENGRDDQDFVNGVNQWSAEDKRQRDLDGVPSLVLNQTKPFCNQVINDIRQARPALRIVPVDSNADPETAEVLSGLIRNIEYRSKASDAYDTAARNAIQASIGWIKVCVDYEHEFTFDQEITIERILNFESAMIDPNSTMLDGSDAEYGVVYEDIPKEKFESLYPEATTEGFEGTFWSSDKTIRVAEYYYRVYDEVDIYQVAYQEGETVVEGVVTKPEIDLLEESGIEVEIVDQRKTRLPKVMQCLLTQNEILDKTEWVGKYIPIIPVVGDEIWTDGRRNFSSLIRQGKDAQRMYNYWKSASTHMIALQPKTPWTGAAGSFDSFPNEWANANRKNYAFLEYDVVYDENGQRVEPPKREAPVQGSPAMMQEAMNAREDIRLAIGMPLSNMGEKDNAISGVAIRNRQIEGDNATFHFIDNLATAMTHLGVILVDLIPKIYSKPQIRRIIGEDGTEDIVPVNQPYVQDKETGKKRPPKSGEQYDGIYRLGTGKYDVVCDIGASYSSQRQEMADKLGELVAAKPELFEVVGDLIFKSLDLPMSEELSERIKATMNPVVLGDDPQGEKLKQAAQQLKAMEEQLLNMDAALKDKRKNEEFEQQRDMEKIKLEREKLVIEANKVNAEIAKIQSEIEENRAQTINQRIENQARMDEVLSRVDDIGEALEIMLDNEERNRENDTPVEVSEVKENDDNE